MALLNQGFVRSLNLDDIEDAILSINNLAGGTITEDLVVFANNDKNSTRLLFKRPIIDSNNSVVTDGDGSVFTQADKIGTFGNGDKVRIRSLIRITNVERDGLGFAALDQLRVTLEKNLPAGFFNPDNGVIKVTMYETRFNIATDQLNNIEYVATGTYSPGESSGPIQFTLNEVGYPEDLDGEGVDQNAIGAFDPDGPSNNLDNYPYIISPQLPGPNVVSGDQIDYNQFYFIVNSNATNAFRIGRNFSRRELIEQIDFGTAFNGPNGDSVVFERTNTSTKDNLINLSFPVFEDESDFDYFNQVLELSINNNFSLLESSLDAATFYTLKKYLSEEYNYYNESELEFSGNLFCSDPDGFNQTPADLVTRQLESDPPDKTPGVFIINKDASSSFDNIITTRAYSDNTQPWELNVDTLEFQSLRDFSGNSTAFNDANQEMTIGNMILQDKASENAVTIGSATEQLQNVEVLSLAAAQNLVGGQPVTASDPNFDRFTHKINVLIDTGNGPEFYSICLSTLTT